MVLSIVRDFCVRQRLVPDRKMSTHSTKSAKSLHKYQFDKTDVEDLTRIEGDFATALPKVSFKNEVESTSVEKLLKRKEVSELRGIDSSLSDMTEESLDRKASVATTLTEEEFSRMKEISKSVDNLEFCDPKSIDMLKHISHIEEQGKEIEKEMKTFIGGSNDIRFYEINEKFIRLMIALCDMHCEKEELRKRKAEVYNYIEGCQKSLKNRRIQSL